MGTVGLQAVLRCLVTCPDCGNTLVRVKKGRKAGYRCGACGYVKGA